MVIEYVGELIRNEVAERREKVYESQVGGDGGSRVVLGGCCG